LTTFQTSAEWNEFLTDIAGYMSRLLAILKHTTLELSILTSDAGEELRKSMDEVRKSYIMSNCCEMLITSLYVIVHKIDLLWLCNEESTQLRKRQHTGISLTPK